MSKYVNVDLLIDKINRIQVSSPWMRVGKAYFTDLLTRYRDAVIKSIEELSAADVREVVHAEWRKYTHYPGETICVCSKCKSQEYIYDTSNLRYWFSRKFCPQCGAEMEVLKPEELLQWLKLK